MQTKYLILSLRPYQWCKNLLVFAALIFKGHLFVGRNVLLSIFTFYLFTFNLFLCPFAE